MAETEFCFAFDFAAEGTKHGIVARTERRHQGRYFRLEDESWAGIGIDIDRKKACAFWAALP